MHDTVSYVEISSRRYLGAKTRLLGFLQAVLQECCGSYASFLDLFAGTGVVANAVNRADRKIITNDLLACNCVAHRCFLGTTAYELGRVMHLLEELQQCTYTPNTPANYVSAHFGGTYFSIENAWKIGAMREQIRIWETRQEITPTENAILLTSLLYATDRIANTCGHYDAFRETLDSSQSLALHLPRIDLHSNQHNENYQQDANLLGQQIEADVVYIDPPYNSRQYSDTYHLLENLVRWEKPPVYGKARKMNRLSIKSAYCTTRLAAAAFHSLIEGLRCQYILVSYNNMAAKGDLRSNACMKDEDIFAALRARGRVDVFEQPFQHFSAGLRQIEQHSERIFVCRIEHKL